MSQDTDFSVKRGESRTASGYQVGNFIENTRQAIESTKHPPMMLCFPAGRTVKNAKNKVKISGLDDESHRQHWACKHERHR